MMSKIILPLDGMTLEKAKKIVKLTSGKVWGYKINDLLLKLGISFIIFLKKYGNVMADPKLYDIPNTMHNSIGALILAGADIITVHMEPGYESLFQNRGQIAGITVLTSMNEDLVVDTFIYTTTQRMVKKFARRALDLGYGYLVCSGVDLKSISAIPNINRISKICPGIRPEWSLIEKDDQVRIMTPSKAIAEGADLLVIGRPITQADDPIMALEKTNKEIEEAKNE